MNVYSEYATECMTEKKRSGFLEAGGAYAGLCRAYEVSERAPWE